MRISLIAIALVATASAAPTTSPYLSFTQPLKRDSSAAQVQASIISWITDVRNVNSFLDAAPNLSGQALAAAAATTTARPFAMDEPKQLSIEGDMRPDLSQAGKNAVAILKANFDANVIASLDAIIASPFDTANVLGSLEIINGARCNIVLPSLDILWPAAADASMAPPNPPKAERPAACQTIL